MAIGDVLAALISCEPRRRPHSFEESLDIMSVEAGGIAEAFLVTGKHVASRQ